MWSTLFQTSIRQIAKNKLYASINVVGLATGILCVLFATLFWFDERNFDTFHTYNPHLYRITTTLNANQQGDRQTTGGTGQVQGPAFKAAVPEVLQYVRLLGGGIYTDVIADDKILHLNSLFVDSTFFKVFSFKILKGHPTDALYDIRSVVVTESTALKFYNTTEVIGRLVSLDADPSFEKLGKPLKIAAVVKDPPTNSSLQFDILYPFSFLQLSFEDKNWLNTYLGTFVVLHPSASTREVIKKMDEVYALHATTQLGNRDYDYYDFNPQIQYGLQRMTDIHLTPFGPESSEMAVTNTSSPIYSYVFMGIALFILMIAILNFVHISIASSLKRAKEVGIRKISGGHSSQILGQFFLESAILCLGAFVVAILCFLMLLPSFNELTTKNIEPVSIVHSRLLVAYLVLYIGITVLSGVYPALILSNFKAADVLYNKQRHSVKNLFGKSLIVIQFSIAVILLVALMVYKQQMDFVGSKDLGYNPEYIIRTSVYGDRDYKSSVERLQFEFKQLPTIQAASFGNDGFVQDVTINRHKFNTQHKGIDDQFIGLMGITILAGHNISSQFNSREVLVNQTFVAEAGLTDPIGQELWIHGHYTDSLRVRIVGVCKDFHFQSLREKILPMILYSPETHDGLGGVWIKLNRRDPQKALADIEKIYKRTFPKSIYQFQFLNELNANDYKKDQQWLKIIRLAGIIAFILCSLGLYGISHLTAERRKKEVGIRKALGASVGQISSMLTLDYLKLILVSLCIAFPLSIVIMNKWLQNFQYKIDLAWWMFLVAAGISMGISALTTLFKSMQAAMINPVEVLRSE